MTALPAAGQAGVVSHVKVLSEKVEDVSSIDAWKRSFIKEGMTETEKALAVWETVVKFRHQEPPPNEYLQHEENVHDAIKTFNVYGYGMCCCAAANIEALGRAAGLQARGRILHGHSVPELFSDGAWRMLDASLINYFPGPDGKPSGVDDIMAGVKEWLAQNPSLRGNDRELRAFMRGGGWKKGPTILANSPFYDTNGWLPAATHGWYSTMQEYDGSATGIYEYGYSQGYQVNVQLRDGERLTRNWFNKGLHVNQRDGGEVGCLTGVPGKDDLRYAPRYGDIAPGRIGNGTLEYDVPLASGALRRGALRAENLACTGEDKRAPALHVKRPAEPGVLVLRMPCSYVYLGGELSVKAVVGPGGALEVAFSGNNGQDWKPVTRVTASGEQRVDLKPLVHRRYDYRLRFTMRGAGTGLDALRVRHDIQHSQRALPALDQGTNRITFSAGPPEGTVTIEGSLDARARGKQLHYTDFHPVEKGLQGPKATPGILALAGSHGSLTFPIATPGPMTRLRFGCHYRARDAGDGWEMQLSFDGGKSFRTAARCAGPTPGSCQYVTFSDVPPGTRQALVRWSGTQQEATCLFGLRIDADYRERVPRGTSGRGGFAPIRATYVWEEGGVEKRDVHVARAPSETYSIVCRERPVMKSLIVERE